MNRSFLLSGIAVAVLAAGAPVAAAEIDKGKDRRSPDAPEFKVDITGSGSLRADDPQRS